ncbi:MAG: type I-B CRISPR-associated protein Cas7/Cst2/DevR [Candidatus Micrarchaeota archaeon]|nr:MAG: type I-B CRISPR-associated protein Cas7/Cst2/DevR [Candidatus Micrarchaeota archaeon]
MPRKNEESEESEEIKSVVNFGDFRKVNAPVSFKKGTVVAIYYSLPSNQNGGGSSGTNVITQKVIPFGKDEMRVYVSPFALKRRIRDYWIRLNDEKVKVYLRESREVLEREKSTGSEKDNNKQQNSSASQNGASMGTQLQKNGNNTDNKNNLSNLIEEYIDIDLFGYMKAESRKAPALTRPGPITTWGAISLEPFVAFVDFNTSVESTTGSSEGGSIINRYISTNFYFTSFFINTDLISIDMSDVEKKASNKMEDKFKDEERDKILNKRKERLKYFFEGVKYAMQKEVGGPRDRPECVFLAVEVTENHYGHFDKWILKNAKIVDVNSEKQDNNKEDANREDIKVKIDFSNLNKSEHGDIYILVCDENYVKLSCGNNELDREKLINCNENGNQSSNANKWPKFADIKTVVDFLVGKIEITKDELALIKKLINMKPTERTVSDIEKMLNDNEKETLKELIKEGFVIRFKKANEDEEHYTIPEAVYKAINKEEYKLLDNKNNGESV